MMKKVVLLFMFLSIFVSCNKSYQCDCSTYDAQGYYISTKTNTYKEKNRERAQTACTAKSNVTQVETIKCVIVN
jgi:uncharacterized protein YxeA